MNKKMLMGILALCIAGTSYGCNRRALAGFRRVLGGLVDYLYADDADAADADGADAADMELIVMIQVRLQGEGGQRARIALRRPRGAHEPHEPRYSPRRLIAVDPARPEDVLFIYRFCDECNTFTLGRGFCGYRLELLEHEDGMLVDLLVRVEENPVPGM